MQENESGTTVCLSCGAELSGKYCSQCGEKTVAGHDKSLSHFFHEFVHLLTHADSRLLKSLKAVLFRPGELTSEYITGRRRKYTSPLSMFVIANLVYLLILPVDALNSRYSSQFGQMYSGMIREQVKKKLVKKNWNEEQLASQYDIKSAKLAKLMLILLVLFFAVPLAILFFGKQRYNFDHLVFSTEVITYVIFAILILIPYLLYGCLYLYSWIFDVGVNFDVNGIAAIVILLTVLTSYFYVSARRVYKQGKLASLVKSVLLVAGMIYVVTLYRYVLFQVTMLML